MAKRKLGRPRKHSIRSGDRVALGLRVTPAMKRKLERTSAHNGRSQCQEAELRLEQSFQNDRIGTLVRAAVSIGIQNYIDENYSDRRPGFWLP